MESNNSQPPVLSPAVTLQSSSGASMSSLTTPRGGPPRLELVTPHPQGQLIKTPQGQTIVVTQGSSRAGPSVVPKTPTSSKRGGRRKSPHVLNVSGEDEEVEVLSDRKPQSYRKSDTNTPDPDKIARSREGERRRRQLQKDSADRLRDLVPTLKAPGPDGKLKKVGEGIVMQQAADYIESLHNEAAQKNNDMGRQTTALGKLAEERFLLYKKAALAHYYSKEATLIMEHLKSGESAPADWWFPELEVVTQLTSVDDLIKCFVKEENIPKLLTSFQDEYTEKLQPKRVSSARQAAKPYLNPQQLRPSMASQVVQGPRPIANPNRLSVRGEFPANPTTMGQLIAGNQIQVRGLQQKKFFQSPRGQAPSASLLRLDNPRMVQMIDNQVSMSSQQTAPFRPVYVQRQTSVYRMNTLTMPLVAAPPSVGSVSNQLKMVSIDPSTTSATGNPGTGAPATPSPTIEDSMGKEADPANVFQQPSNPSDDCSRIMEAFNLEHLKEETIDSDDGDNFSMLGKLEEAGGGISLGVVKEETVENNDHVEGQQIQSVHSPASQMDLGDGPATTSGAKFATFGDPMSSSMGGTTPGRCGETGLRYTWDLDVNDLGPRPAWWSDVDSDDDPVPSSNPVRSGASANTDEPQPSTSRGHRGRNPSSVDWNVEKDNEAFKNHPLFKYNFMFSGIGTTHEDFEKANSEIRDIAAACWAEVQEESRQKEAEEEQRRMEMKRKSPKRRKSDHGRKKSTLDDDSEGSSDDE